MAGSRNTQRLAKFRAIFYRPTEPRPRAFVGRRVLTVRLHSCRPVNSASFLRVEPGLSPDVLKEPANCPHLRNRGPRLASVVS